MNADWIKKEVICPNCHRLAMLSTVIIGQTIGWDDARTYTRMGTIYLHKDNQMCAAESVKITKLSTPVCRTLREAGAIS